MFDHERVVIATGSRSKLPVIVAVHSTALGSSAGGCRMLAYPRWQDGLEDALRLSRNMTLKSAAAGLPHGGGKTVVALPAGIQVDDRMRRAALLDVGDVVESLAGGYATGPDVGTSAHDMVTIAERTTHVCCLPEEHGGSGDSSGHTAAGVLSAIHAACAHLFGSASLAGRTIGVVGLGNVGGGLARMLAAEGARLIVTDTDPGRRALAGEVGATWVDPASAVTTPVDVLVPAAVGGMLTAEVVSRLRCEAIVGPANNQLATEDVAELLRDKGICWVPDYIASAGGVVYAVSRELDGLDHATASAAVRGIGDTVRTLLDAADRDAITPHRAALRLAADRLEGRALSATM